jgi:hypothetical protein
MGLRRVVKFMEEAKRRGIVEGEEIADGMSLRRGWEELHHVDFCSLLTNIKPAIQYKINTESHNAESPFIGNYTKAVY